MVYHKPKEEKMAESIDRRVRRTHALLGDALEALILEKGYEAVTIKDITDRADVAYATFFRHYHDKDDLLARYLEEGINELQARIHAGPESLIGAGEGRLIFDHAQENARFYRILLTSPGTINVRRRITEFMAAHLLETCPPLHEGPGLIPAEVAAHHIAASLLSLIEWWLARELPYPPERMGEIYDALIAQATLNAVAAVAA